MFRQGREMHEAPGPDLKKVFLQNQPIFFFFKSPLRGVGGLKGAWLTGQTGWQYK
jgi:hypothetical protein